MFTTAEIVERLKVLWRKLEDEGSYVSGNTIQLAVARLEELSKPEAPDKEGARIVTEASRDEWANIAVQRGLEMEELHETNGRLRTALKLIINERWTTREWVKDIARRALA